MYHEERVWQPHKSDLSQLIHKQLSDLLCIRHLLAQHQYLRQARWMTSSRAEDLQPLLCRLTAQVLPAFELGWLTAWHLTDKVCKQHRLTDPNLPIAMEPADPAPVPFNQPTISHLEKRWNLRFISSAVK